jgi:hypothetical protein
MRRGRAVALRLQHRLRHLLHKQGNAIGPLDYVPPDARRQQFFADNAVDHRAYVALCQPIDGEGCHVRLSDPRWVEFRPEGHDQQHGKDRALVHNSTEHFQARRVGPMRILENHQHWIRAC